MLILASAIAAGLSCKANPPPPVSPPPEPAAAEENEADNVPQDAAVDPPPPVPGTVLRGETLSMTVTGSLRAPELYAGPRRTRPGKGNTFLVVDLEFTNRGVTSARVRAEHFRVTADDGNDYPVSTTHQLAFSRSADELLLPGKQTDTFQVIFVLPKIVRPRALIYAEARTQLVGGL